jgi:hypothetical protein
MFRGSLGRLVLIALAAGVVAGCGRQNGDGDDMGSASATPAGEPMADAVEYTVIFRNSWTRESHPFEYPEAGAVSGPHYSGLIGASHNASYSVFASGATPTLGLERLSEEGRHSPLDDEIRAAVAAGTAGQLFTTGPLRDLKDSLMATVRVSATHPLVSVVAMIAPSPDWFTGVAGVNLMENGAWVASRTLPAYAWDSGGDDGLTYKAPDRNNDPRKPTMQAQSAHFVMNGAPVPVGTITFVRK